MEYGMCTYILREKSITSTVLYNHLRRPHATEMDQDFSAHEAGYHERKTHLLTYYRPTNSPLYRPRISDHGLKKSRTRNKQIS